VADPVTGAAMALAGFETHSGVFALAVYLLVIGIYVMRALAPRAKAAPHLRVHQNPLTLLGGSAIWWLLTAFRSHYGHTGAQRRAMTRRVRRAWEFRRRSWAYGRADLPDLIADRVADPSGQDFYNMVAV
jgi:hypothetical protein